MRNLVIALTISFLLAGCSSDKENHGSLNTLKTAPQTFSINPNERASLETEGGVKVIIPPGVFVFEDGQPALNSIQLELLDVFTKSDMILNGISTISDGRLIESFGMVFAKATSEGKNLVIREGGAIGMEFPDRLNKSDGALFYGHESDTSFNWEFVPGSIPETPAKVDEGERDVQVDDAVDSVEDSMRPKGYQFVVQRLGWINCDRFVDYEEKTALEIELSNYNTPSAYLVFRNINSVMKLYVEEQGNVIVENLPKGFKVDLVVIDNINDRYYWAKEEITLGRQQKVTVKTKRWNLTSIKKALQELDK